MTHQDIIEMAKQAGMVQDGNVWFSANNYEQSDVHTVELEAFAKLIAAKEREECALLCEEERINAQHYSATTQSNWLAKKIRNRK